MDTWRISCRGKSRGHNMVWNIVPLPPFLCILCASRLLLAFQIAMTKFWTFLCPHTDFFCVCLMFVLSLAPSFSSFLWICQQAPFLCRSLSGLAIFWSLFWRRVFASVLYFCKSQHNLSSTSFRARTVTEACVAFSCISCRTFDRISCVSGT